MTLSTARDSAKDNPTSDGTVRTCSSEGAPQAPPPGFAPPEGEETIEDGEVIGFSAEDQLNLRALCIKITTCRSRKKYLKPCVNESLCKPKCVR
jgi:hypothetical protein